jgi:hypothetical protein
MHLIQNSRYFKKNIHITTSNPVGYDKIKSSLTSNAFDSLSNEHFK